MQQTRSTTYRRAKRKVILMPNAQHSSCICECKTNKEKRRPRARTHKLFAARLIQMSISNCICKNKQVCISVSAHADETRRFHLANNWKTLHSIALFERLHCLRSAQRKQRIKLNRFDMHREFKINKLRLLPGLTATMFLFVA